MDLTPVSILDMPDDVNAIVLEAIGNGEVETVRIHFQRLLSLMERQGDLVGRMTCNGKHGIARESMTGQMIFAAIDRIGIIVDTTDNGEQDG